MYANWGPRSPAQLPGPRVFSEYEFRYERKFNPPTLIYLIIYRRYNISISSSILPVIVKFKYETIPGSLKLFQLRWLWDASNPDGIFWDHNSQIAGVKDFFSQKSRRKNIENPGDSGFFSPKNPQKIQAIFFNFLKNN